MNILSSIKSSKPSFSKLILSWTKIWQGRVPTPGRESFRLDISLRWGQNEELEMVNPFISEKTSGCLRLQVLELFPHPRFGYLLDNDSLSWSKNLIEKEFLPYEAKLV